MGAFLDSNNEKSPASDVKQGISRPEYRAAKEDDMRISEINRSALTRTLVDKLLYDSLEYSGERADLIIVLGSSKASRYRVPEAAKLYFAGRAEYLLLKVREIKC